MKATLSTILVLVALGELACAADGSSRAEEDNGDGTAESSTTEPSTTTLPTTTTPTTTLTTSTTDDPSTSTDPSGTGTDDDTSPPDPFEFDESPPEEYAQIDRMGMPAVMATLVTSKDAYNQATPIDDVTAQFVPELSESLGALHAALDDDIVELGFTPCMVDDCGGQVVPLVVPDVLRLDLTAEPGFPNGRRLDDPAVDFMLAAMLLDLEQHDLDTLAELPLNPQANDVELLPDFPYLPEPH